MAVRIDLYAVGGGVDLETLGADQLAARPEAPAEHVTWAGFVSAADADEDELTDLLGRIAATGVLGGASQHGVGPQTEEVDEAAVALVATVTAGTDHARAWRDTIAAAVRATAEAGHRLGWWTRYDRGGSISDGDDEWPTAWSDPSA